MAKADIAKKHYEWYEKSRDDTRDWREDRDRCDMAYFGNQWEPEVSDSLRAKGQVDVVMNIQRTLIRNRVSSMIANKPKGEILGVKKGDLVEAAHLNDFLDWHWYNSYGQLVAERVVMGQQRKGVHYFLVALDPKADYGRGELKIYDANYRNVFVPKATRQWDFSDSPYVQVSKLLTLEDFVMKNPGYKNKELAGYLQGDDEIRWTGKKEHRKRDELDLPQGMVDVDFIREIDTYERFFKEMRVIYYVPTQTVNVIDDNYTLNDNENRLLKDGLIQELRAPVPRIRYTKTYGDKIFKYSEVLPIEDYPVVPVPDEDTGNSMSLGEIDQTWGVQELANKAWSLVILNAALNSNFKMLIDAGRADITDIDSIKKQWAAPGAVINMKIDPVTGKFPVEIVRPEPLNQAFYGIFERLASHIQFGMATFNDKLGDSSSAPNTFSATLQYGEWQKENLRIPLSRFELGLQRVFDIILQWAPKHYTFYRMFDIMSDTGKTETKSINEPQFDPVKKAITVINDIRNVRARFRIRTGSTLPTQSVAFLNIYERLAAINPVFLKHLVEYLPVKEKEELIKELDAVAQLTEQNQKLQQDLNTISGMLQNALRQQAESEIRQDVREASLELEKILADQRIITKEMKSDQKLAKKELSSQQKEKKKSE